MNQAHFYTLSGILILGLSLVTLVFDWIPFIWIGGFILTVFLFINAFEVNKTEALRKEREAEFRASDKWRTKASDSAGITSRVGEITNQYGLEYAIEYLTDMEKMSKEKAVELVSHTLVADAFSSPQRKSEANRCLTCDGFGTVFKKRRRILGTFSEKSKCQNCNGSGSNKI